jgi:GDP-4-dehydro-6-deoxy-D-mannose reductase
VVRAYRALMGRGRPGEAYHVCSGTDRSVRELADILSSLSSADITLETDPDLMRPVDLKVLQGDNTKISTDTDWSPSIPIEQTLEDLLEFWRGEVLS